MEPNLAVVNRFVKEVRGHKNVLAVGQCGSSLYDEVFDKKSDYDVVIFIESKNLITDNSVYKLAAEIRTKIKTEMNAVINIDFRSIRELGATQLTWRYDFLQHLQNEYTVLYEQKGLDTKLMLEQLGEQDSTLCDAIRSARKFLFFAYVTDIEKTEKGLMRLEDVTRNLPYYELWQIGLRKYLKKNPKKEKGRDDRRVVYKLFDEIVKTNTAETLDKLRDETKEFEFSTAFAIDKIETFKELVEKTFWSLEQHLATER